MDNFTNPSHDIGVNSDANSTDGMEACSITKVSRYPDETCEDSKARHSFGVSIIEPDQVSTLQSPCNNPTIITLRDDLALQKQDQSRVTQDTIPSLSLQQRISNQI